MLDAEQVRLLVLENTTADDFLVVVAARRELGKLNRYLKISKTVDVETPPCRTKLPFESSFKLARKPRPKEFIVLVSKFSHGDDLRGGNLLI